MFNDKNKYPYYSSFKKTIKDPGIIKKVQEEYERDPESGERMAKYLIDKKFEKTHSFLNKLQDKANKFGEFYNNGGKEKMEEFSHILGQGIKSFGANASNKKK